MARQDFGQLARVIRSATRVAQGVVGHKAIRAMGDTTHKLAVDGARAARNAAGRAWKPLKKGGGRALRMMAGSLGLKVGLSQFRVRSRYPWAGFHNKGAQAARKAGPLPPKGIKGASLAKTRWRLPKRSILPKKSLPKQWKEPVYAAAAAAWNRNWTSSR